MNERFLPDQRELLRQQRLAVLGKLVATIAHKIGTPLTAISGHLQLLMEDPTLSPGVQQRLQTVFQQSNRLKLAMQDLLDFSRVPTLSLEPISIPQCIGQTLQLFLPILEKQHVLLTTGFGVGLPPACGDPVRLQEAFSALIDNALDAMPKGGELDVKVWYDGTPDSLVRESMICIDIQDSGVGIPEHLLDKVLEPFFTTKEAGEGTGLGLAITSEIIQRHNGTLLLHSEEGHGTTVCVRIPTWSEPG